MNFIELYDRLNQTQKTEFSRIANKLLAITLLTKKKEDNKKDYYFITTHKDLFIEYFEYMNWEVEINEAYGVIHLNNIQNTNRKNFNLNESIILLVLRKIYQSKLEELSLAENVTIRIEEIKTEYDGLKIRNKQLDKTTLRNAVRLFKRYNIVDPLDSDYALGDTRLIIYPTILMAIKVDDIMKLNDKLRSYDRGGDDDEEVDEDQTD
ncbi:DUF4194 domain-containing protein [Haloplasma contractile]|uniref:DUF4194 domain-containing protein n=1 Tax=Haloplasma contractile SSD-17B TaxID=1033810 RepID=F7Q1U2_9MOLU|nr:DUF4194 domain-containing protein [Haloplasma contractile]ERJ12247.1 hypothetical protein HLPCO_001774 [Haloplasma contractile SSD-17B]